MVSDCLISSNKKTNEKKGTLDCENDSIYKSSFFTCAYTLHNVRCQPLAASHNDRVFDVELRIINYNHLLSLQTKI